MSEQLSPVAGISRFLSMGFIIVLTSILLIGVTAWEIVVNGPFRWSFAHPQSWQGGIEAIILAVLVVLGFRLNRRWAFWILVISPATLYARRHAVDLALLIDVTYVEIVVALGFRVRGWAGGFERHTSIDYLHAFATGFLTWSLCAWLCSALNFGSIHDLRWLTLILAVMAWAGPRHAPSLCGFLYRGVRASSVSARAWCGVLATWLLVLFARSKIAIGYDARWYGLQPEHMLVPNHSIFEPLGLVSPVHYYPKIFEMWLLPLSATGDSTILSGISLLAMLLVLIACRQLMLDSGLAKSAHMPVLALIATIPALTEIAGQPKPDVFATLFILLSTIAATRFIRRPTREAACWVITGSAVASSAKLTAVPYAGILILILAFAGWKNRSSRTADSDEQFRPALLTTLLALSVSGFVAARTWYLTGLPTIGPDPLFKLWHFLGFTLREPAGTLNWSNPKDWTSVPLLFYDHLFRPQLVGHIATSWTGNVWLWFVCIALCAATIIRAPATMTPVRIIFPMLALAVLALATALGVGFMIRGGDGNYFLFGLLPAIIISAAAAFRQLGTSPRLGMIALACVPAFVLFQAGYSFLSGSWTSGTRVLDANFSNGFKGMQVQNRLQLADSGLARIAERLSESRGDRRVVGRVEENVMFIIPARYEDLAVFSYSRPEHIADAAALISYMLKYQITCIILPGNEVELKDPSGLNTAIDAAGILKVNALTEELTDSRYVLIDASKLAETDWVAATNLARAKSQNTAPKAAHVEERK